MKAKRIINVFSVPLISFISLSLISCSDFFLTSDKQRVALVTDVGDIDDRSFNQGTWEGIINYLDNVGYEIERDYKFFRPVSQAPADYLSSIDDAITWGAEAVICPGFLFEPAIYQAQYLYPDVKFLLEDGVPHPQNDFSKIDIRENTIAVYFKEHESGFLAGYAAVYDGARDLGYMGGTSVPAVKKFGAGYVAGAYYAANELKLDNVIINNNKFEYLGSFKPSADVKSKAGAWYQGGTDVIFTAAGGAGASVMSAAEEANKLVIGVDVDQASMSKTVLTSAKKNLSKAVEIFLDRFFNEWKGGEILSLGVSMDGVSLPTEISNGVDPWRFKTFTKEQYHLIFNKIKEGELRVPSDYENLKKFVNDLGFELKITKEKFDDLK